MSQETHIFLINDVSIRVSYSKNGEAANDKKYVLTHCSIWFQRLQQKNRSFNISIFMILL